MRSYPLLVLDTGNSSLKWTLIDENGTFHKTNQCSASRLEVLDSILEEDFEGIAFSSVVPQWSEKFIAETQRRGIEGVFQVSSLVSLPFELDVDEPEQVGSDRLAAASGAYSLGYREAVIVDVGTAVTVDLVEGGSFRGGVIFPGPEMLCHSLSEGTAILPGLERVDQGVDPPGRTTEEAIQCGVVWGIAGAVEKVIGRMREKSGYRIQVVATGGGWNRIDSRIEEDYKYYPNLTIRGIEYLYRAAHKI